MWEILSKENVIKMIVTGLPTLLIAFVIPFISIRFALRQFYTQKWWETKSIAYSRIIELLSNYRFASGELFNHYLTSEVYSKLIINKYELMLSESFHEIQRQRSIGAFVVSTEVIKELDFFVRRVDTNQDLIDGNKQGALDSNSGFAGECIDKIKAIAKKDLKIK